MIKLEGNTQKREGKRGGEKEGKKGGYEKRLILIEKFILQIIKKLFLREGV